MGVTSDVAGGPAATGDVRLGREAFARRSWAAARELLLPVDQPTLTAEDLHSLATAAYLVADRDTALAAWQRAFQLHTAAGDPRAAALDAHWLAFVYFHLGNQAVAGGWVARGHRLLDGEPDAVEHGFYGIHEFFSHLGAQDFAGAGACSERILQIGRRWGNADLIAFGLMSGGRMLIYSGRVPEGVALLDEAMVGVASGEVSPIVSGETYCSLIEACQELSDYRRMSEWTEALTTWCGDQPDLVPFTGQCAVHRGQILRNQGSFVPALEELALAAERYAANGLEAATGLALYERGEVLRTQGDLDGAEAAYTAAAPHGYEPQPGLSLLQLARGRTAAAVAAARRLASEPTDPVARARRLPAIVEILLAGGEVGEARVAADDLVDLASGFCCDAVTAAAAHWAGTVSLAEGDASGALPQLRRAWKLWIDLGARYDAAWARTRIGLALRALGDEASATSELTVAARTFAELGAGPAGRAVSGWLVPASLPDGLTAREVEVLRLVATGQSNPQVAAALFLSEKTVARHLSNIFAKTGVTSRTAAATYAHQHDLA
jgi:DNA-binding CsgD family transcriptional regulator